MLKVLLPATLLLVQLTAAQVTTAPSESDKSAGIPGLTSDSELRGKTSLVRGVLTRFDPIHDQLIVRAFGGRDIRIAFDTRTVLFRGNTSSQVSGIPAGSVVSVDTVIDQGKLFARTVRFNAATVGELSGQVVRYDAPKARLILRDPISPDNTVLRVTPSTSVTAGGKPASLQALHPGALVHVKFSPAQNDVTNVEVLAERGNAFTFAGRVISVDLRTREVALSNDSDQSVREVAIGSLDATSQRLLREGANVSIDTEFDGDRYNARAVKLVPESH